MNHSLIGRVGARTAAGGSGFAACPEPDLQERGALQPIPQVAPWFDEAELQSVVRVLRDGWITEGPASAAFAGRLNELVGVPYGAFAPNGTLALTLGLLALGIGPGDEVLVPDTTFIGSATSVVLAGARPVFVDVEPATYQLDVERAAERLSPRTRAVMPVHLYGTACDMEAVLGFAASHGLKVIEDAAQGIGVTFRGRHVGSFGDVGCFSFFADKTITTGEGGYVACRDPEIYERLRSLRNQGRRDRGSFVHPEVGFNFRITDLQAALGLAQLDRLPAIVERKVALHERYRSGLAGLPQVRLLGAAPEATLVPFRCVLMADAVAELAEHLEAGGVQTRPVFHPLHRQPCFAGSDVARGGADDDFPNAMEASRKGLCLPVFPTMTDEQVDGIVELICGFYG